MLKDNKWNPKQNHYHPPILPSQKNYTAMHSSRSFSRRLDLQVSDSLRSSANPFGQLQPQTLRHLSESQSFHISIQQIPNQRLRVVCVELQYILSKNGFMNEEVQKVYSNLLGRISQEVQRMADTTNKLQKQLSMSSRPQSPRQPCVSNSNAGKLKKISDEDKKQRGCKDHLKLVVENTKLAAINQALALRVKQLSASLPQLSHVVETTSTETDKLKQNAYSADRCRYLEMKLSHEENRTAVLAKDIESMKTENLQLILERDEMKETVIKIQQERNMWRERSMIQTEELYGLEHRQQMILNYVKRMKDNKRGTDFNSTQKNFNNSQHSECIKINPRGDMFSYQVDFFKQVRNLTDNNKVAQFRLPLKYKNEDLQAQVGNLQYQISNMRLKKQQQVYLPRFTYWKPTFYNMIQHLPASATHHDVHRTFIQKIRCIMNSKFNEFLLIDDVESYTRFPEFVLNWLDKYDFQPTTKELVLRPPEEESLAREFYTDLMNYKLGQNWEIISFREFLLEQLSMEELYFYLHCQNILYRRCGVTLEKQYFGDFIILVDFAVAKSVISVILSQFDSWNISYFLGKLGERMIIRSNRQMIDSGFCLRCLLEFYKLERVNRFRFIQNTVKQNLQATNAIKLGFPEFMGVFREFTELSYLSKLKIYRDCYSVGRGTITPQVIFTVCNESRVFLNVLRIKSFYKLPILRTSDQHNQIQPALAYLPKLFEQMRQLLQTHSQFSEKVRKLGVEQISTTVQNFRKYFLQKRLISDNSIMRCRHFIHYIGQLLAKIKTVNYNNLYEVIQSVDKRAFQFTVDVDQNCIGVLYNNSIQVVLKEFQTTQDLIEWKRRVTQFRCNRAAKRIQRYIRAKFIQPYLELYSNMLAKARTLVGHNLSSTVPSKTFAQLKSKQHNIRNGSMQTKGKKTFN